MDCSNVTTMCSTFYCTSSKNRMREFEVITPNFFTELGKYPKVTTYFSKRNRAHEDEAVEFLNKGIEQGYFRPDVNFVIITDNSRSD